MSNNNNLDICNDQNNTNHSVVSKININVLLKMMKIKLCDKISNNQIPLHLPIIIFGYNCVHILTNKYIFIIKLIY